MGKTVYTVGHSTRTLEELIALLKSRGVRAVVDVRRWPTSRKFPWFCRDKLEEALEKEGIKYYWLGDLLGGYREGGYEAYMKTEDYRRGIEKLTEIIEEWGNGEVAIMCRERLWFRCHRRFIADTLVGMGYKVVHLVDEKREYEHRGRKAGLRA